MGFPFLLGAFLAEAGLICGLAAVVAPVVRTAIFLGITVGLLLIGTAMLRVAWRATSNSTCRAMARSSSRRR